MDSLHYTQMTSQPVHDGSPDLQWAALLGAQIAHPGQENSSALQHEPMVHTPHFPQASIASPFQIGHAVTALPRLYLGRPRSEAWTQEQDDFMRELKDRGTTHPVIATQLLAKFGIHRTPNVISKRLKKLRDGCIDEFKLSQAIQNAVPQVQQILINQITSLGLVEIEDPEGSLLAEASEEVKEILPRVLEGYLREVAFKMMSETRAS
ncbi:hypothetical protein B0T22DRAFT_171725 [Podospora appendiculata]|uniref:Uncharacterized protein n=1 Tax=Podospora appendiculata TaxID=314037 RepID=A0AAE0XBY8_9PEZI|nr:hypothetical protein B0T22DRAFT_171725 [Podospora appendiculata]